MTIAGILEQKGHAVATIAEDATIAEANALLAEGNFGALVVLDGQSKIAGILSERDIVRHIHESGQATLGAPVSIAMTANPLTCTTHGTVGDVLQMMAGWHIRHLPVVENGVLLGMVSMGDLIRSIIERDVLNELPPVSPEGFEPPQDPLS